jgi:hypothetical protein
LRIRLFSTKDLLSAHLMYVWIHYLAAEISTRAGKSVVTPAAYGPAVAGRKRTDQYSEGGRSVTQFLPEK